MAGAMDGTSRRGRETEESPRESHLHHPIRGSPESLSPMECPASRSEWRS